MTLDLVHPLAVQERTGRFIMTVKAAARRLTISVFTLLASIVDLIVAIVRLLTRAAVLGAEALEKRQIRTIKLLPAKKAFPVETVVEPVVETVEDRPDTKARLSTALVGLGFKQAQVRQYVSSVEGRVARGEPIEILIKDGLRALVCVRAS
jgi:hypothetical protein